MNANNTYISTFLPLIQGDKTPSTVIIKVPVIGSSSKINVTGIVDSDITFTLSNKFGPILPDVSDLQEIFSIMEQSSMPSWIGTSSQVWKGTNPISFSFDMYVINWSPKCNSEESLKKLAELCTVSPAADQKGTSPSEWTVTVHGGYQASILKGNKGWFTDGADPNLLYAKGDGSKAYSEDAVQYQKSTLDDKLSRYTTSDGNNGTITLYLGSKIKLSQLILTRCDITPSVVEVYSPSAGVKPRPLYYRVGLSMQTCRTALSTDIPGLFGLS